MCDDGHGSLVVEVVFSGGNSLPQNSQITLKNGGSGVAQQPLLLDRYVVVLSTGMSMVLSDWATTPIYCRL